MSTEPSQANATQTNATAEIVIPLRTYRTGLLLMLAAVSMLFAGLTSALVVRKGLSDDWRRLVLPPILNYSAVLLFASSLWVERVRRRFRERLTAFHLSAQLVPVLILGAGFVACQLLAWHELRGRGVSLGTNPSSSFFYLLTATLTVLVLGGLAGTAHVILQARGPRSDHRAVAMVNAVATYWHFMTALWIYLLVLLAVNM